MNILNIMCENNLAASFSEAKRLILQGAVKVNDLKIENPYEVINKDSLIKVGKTKNFNYIISEDDKIINYLREISADCGISPKEFIESCARDFVELNTALINAISKKFSIKFPELQLNSDQEGLFIDYLEDQMVNDEAEDYLDYLREKVLEEGNYEINIEILEPGDKH